MRVKSTTCARGGKKGVDHPPLGLYGEDAPPPPQVRVLIVDDDLSLREITALFLSGHGCDCTAVGEVTAAIRCLENAPFDLVITDLHLPDMDGMDLLKWVRQRGLSTKVMMITGDTDPRVRGLALALGVTKFVAKPFALDNFLHEVMACQQNPLQTRAPWPAYAG